jgi:hypothetical protein
VRRTMLAVEEYPKRFNVKEVRVLERTPASVRYELELGVAFAPTVPGYIESPSEGRVVFHDQNTGADFIWTLDGVENGCNMRYSLLETPGKASGWVSVVRTLNESMVDAANFAAAIGSARGYTKPEKKGAQMSAAGETAFFQLAGHGTAVRFLRSQGGEVPAVVARRVVARSVDEVLWSIRDKKRWKDNIDVFTKIVDKGRSATYTVGAFGGRVTWTTEISESGDPNTAEGLLITEKVVSGDLSKGSWQWRIRAVPGGSDVELLWDVDIPKGSSIMITIAETDPSARESMTIHMALAFAGKIIGGKPLGAQTLAKVP